MELSYVGRINSSVAFGTFYHSNTRPRCFYIDSSIVNLLDCDTMTVLNTDTEKTEILPYSSSSERIIKEESEFFSKANNRIDICIESAQPPLLIRTGKIKKSIFDAKSRDTKTRCITEITRSNLSFCKELMKITRELRHLEGVKANFMVSEKEYLIAPLGLFHDEKLRQQGESLSRIVYSNMKEIVEEQQYLFDSLWSKAVPAEQRIGEIEEGTIRYETRIISNPDEIIKEISQLITNSNELATCLTSGGMYYSHKNFFDTKKKLLDEQREGKHKGIRYISDINEDNVNLAKILVDAGIQLRHAKILPPMSFAVTDKEIATTIEKMENGNHVHSLLISNEPVYLNHFRNIFEEIWNSGINAVHRIKDIEEGRQTDDELADAKRYLDEVLDEVTKMRNGAMIKENLSS